MGKATSCKPATVPLAELIRRNPRLKTWLDKLAAGEQAGGGNHVGARPPISSQHAPAPVPATVARPDTVYPAGRRAGGRGGRRSVTKGVPA